MKRNQTSAEKLSFFNNGAFSLPRNGQSQWSVLSGRPGMQGFRQKQHESRLRVLRVGEGPYTVLSCIVLSDRGMYLRSSQPLADYSILRLRLFLPHSLEALDVLGEVTPMALYGTDASPEPGTGVLFVEPSEKILRQIRNFIEWEMTDLAGWEPVLSDTKPIEDFDILVQAALFYGTKPRPLNAVTHVPAFS